MSSMIQTNPFENESYPLLPKIAYATRWVDGFISLLEAFIMSISSLLLTIGIAISMGDFLTGGAALQNTYMFNSWAIIQTLAIDSQFISMWFRSRLAFKEGHFWRGLGYAMLGSALGFVAFGANSIPSLQQALHTNFDGALAALNLNAVDLVYLRSAVVIILAVIAAYNRTVLMFDASGKRVADLQQSAPVVAQKPAKIKKVKAQKPAKVKVEKGPRFWSGWGKKQAPQPAQESTSTAPENATEPAPILEQKPDENLVENATETAPVFEEKPEENEVETAPVFVPETAPVQAQIDQEIERKSIAFMRENPTANEEDLAAHLGENWSPTIARLRIMGLQFIRALEHDTGVQILRERDTDETPVVGPANQPAAPVEPVEPDEPTDDQEPKTGPLSQDDENEGYTSSGSQFNQIGSTQVPQSPRRVLIGLPIDEVIDHPILKSRIPGDGVRAKKKREFVVNSAISDGNLKRKSDGSIARTAVENWAKNIPVSA